MNSIPELIEDIRQGKMVVLVDDEDRENEGDLICAADHTTPETINFMAREARGLICLALTADQLERLGIPLMVQDNINLSPNKTAFTVSIESSHGVSTGISAADRAHTIRVASNPQSGPTDIIMPGHVFPIQAQSGGVLKRAGHTEASVDLSVLAGLSPAATICEIMNEDGSMARVPDLKKFAKTHGIKIGTIEDLIQYRIENDTFVEKQAEATLPSCYGEGFRIHVFHNSLDGREHLALVKGEITSEEPTLVRMHSEYVMGDVFGSLRTPSGLALQNSMKKINDAGKGVIVYLRNEDMGQRLVNRVRAYEQMDNDESPADLESAFQSDRRDYGVGAQILRSLGVRKIRLLTNHPVKRVGIRAYGLEVVESVHLDIEESSNETQRSEIRWLM